MYVHTIFNRHLSYDECLFIYMYVCYLFPLRYWYSVYRQYYSVFRQTHRVFGRLLSRRTSLVSCPALLNGDLCMCGSSFSVRSLHTTYIYKINLRSCWHAYIYNIYKKYKQIGTKIIHTYIRTYIYTYIQ